MKAAVLVNPFAGGADAKETICSAINGFLQDCTVFSSLEFGGTLIHASLHCNEDSGDYRDRLFSTVGKLATQEPDFYLVAGGDGFAAYIADRLLKTGQKNPKIVGVAMGTANVGPIVSFSAEALIGAKPEQLVFSDCGAIEAFDGERSLAFGFNDIVLGNTILGTVEGKPQPISARAMVQEGKKLPEAPLAQIGSSLTVTKNDLRSSVPLERVSQIVVSAVERERLYGRAVTGMLCFTCWQQAHAALLFSERPLVVVDYDPRGFETPALCSQMVFGEEDEVTLSGLVPEALVIADGNPYLRSFESVTLRYRPGVIQTANLVK